MASDLEGTFSDLRITDQAEVRLNCVSRRPDGKDVPFKEKVKQTQEKIRKDPVYASPQNIVLIPETYAPRIDPGAPRDCGRGHANESIIKNLFQQFATSTTDSYFVVHGHKFHSKLIDHDLTILLEYLAENDLPGNYEREFACESDFILIHPTKGIIFMEVSALESGNPELLEDKKRKQCLRASAALRAMVHYILKYKNSPLVDDILESRLKKLFDSFACYVLFPSLSRSSVTESSVDASGRFRTLFKEDRETPVEMKSTIEAAFGEVEDTALYREVFEIALACCILTRKCTITNGLRTLKDANANTEEKEKQLNHMNIIFWNDTQLMLRESSSNVMYVEGIAGSGKTLIMLEKAKKLFLLHPEDKILILCYNEKLQSHLDQIVKDCLYGDKRFHGRNFGNIEVLDVHSFLKLLKDKLNLPRTVLSLFEDVRTATPREKERSLVRRLEAAIDQCWKSKFSKLYQHVLIDEFQDYSESRALLEELFLRRLLQGQELTNGTFWVFYDNDQGGMHGFELGYSEVEAPDYVPSSCQVFMDTSYRSTGSVTRLAMSVSRYRDAYKLGHEYEGPEVCITYPDGGTNLLTKLEEIIRDLQGQGHREEDIVLIYKNRFDEWNTSNDLNHLNCKGSTIFHYKGLESDVVVYVDPPDVRKATGKGKDEAKVAALYTGVSRARWKCCILAKNQANCNALKAFVGPCSDRCIHFRSSLLTAKLFTP